MGCYEEKTNKNNIENNIKEKKDKIYEKSIKKKDKKKDKIKSDDKEKEKEKKLLNTKSKEETKILLESLFKSYYAAKTYFNKNELKEKEVDAIHCCKKITEAQDLLNSGKHKEIDISKLPKELKSEYITGYTPEERKNKINEIIKLLEKEREDTRNILNKKVEDMKKALKKQKNPNMEQAKKILDEDKNHIDEIKKEINIIKKTLLDDYIPVPLYMTVNKSYKKEKINEEIDKNKMVIKLNGISYTKSNPIVIFAIRGENINIHQEIKGKNQEEMYKEFIWEFTEEQFKNLIKYKIEIILARSYTFKSTKAKGKGEIQLRKLKDRSNIDENVKIQMQSGKSDTNMDVEIKLRSPIIDKEYEDDFREIIQIVKIYPKFEFSE